MKVTVPNIGDFADVEVIEVHVAVGDAVEPEQGLITLETEKATLDVPCPEAGVVQALHVKVGDKVSEGTLVIDLATEAASDEPVESSQRLESTPSSAAQTIPMVVPDIGDFAGVDVIEVHVAPGDTVEAEAGLITLETEKATLEVPAECDGTIVSIQIKVGDKVSQGDVIGEMQIALGSDSPEAPAAAPAAVAPAMTASVTPPATHETSLAAYRDEPAQSAAGVYAGPATRRLARELGVNLSQVPGTGPKGRVTKEDLQAFVKGAMAKGSNGGSSLGIEPMPSVDFSQFGEIDITPLTRIQKRSARNLHRNWVTIPHVTQFDEADITEMEAFRQENKNIAMESGVKLTPLVFLMKAVVATLKTYPRFNCSLASDGESLIQKHFYHIGVAVDTPNGLVVPVIRNVDAKSMLQLAKELGEMSLKAREGKLGPKDMQGSSFTISSLGGIGGTAFTPIVNAPDVAILGVSRSQMKPVFQGEDFVPRLMLPLSLSYDHRVIDGADAARFTSHLSSVLSDIKKLILL